MPKNQRLSQFFVITLITLTSVLGIASLPPAFPAIAKQFNLPLDKIGILMGVFTLPGILLTPFFGYLADKYSRKVVLIPSLLLFGIAGLACSFAASFDQLVFFRLIQGIGVAPLGALNISLIGDLFAPEERSRYTGFNSTVLSLGTAFFPLIGGYLSLIGWNVPFYLSAFAFLVAVLFLIFFNKSPKIPSQIRLKQILDSFTDKVFRKILVFNCLSYFVVIGTLFTYLPFHLKNTFGLESDKIGIYLFILSISAAISASFLQLIIKKLGEVNLLKLQFLCFFVALLILPNVSQILIILPIILFGAAFGATLPGMQFWMLKITPPEKRASNTAFYRAISQLGQTSGPILMGILLTQFHSENSVVVVFYFGSALSILAFASSFFMFRRNVI